MWKNFTTFFFGAEKVKKKNIASARGWGNKVGGNILRYWTNKKSKKANTAARYRYFLIDT